MRRKELNYSNLDVIKYIFAIIIIIVHLRPFLNDYKDLDLFFNNVIGRVCVPFYFFIASYFVAKKDSSYIKKYIKSTIPLYLTWSIIYIPFGIREAFHYFPDVITWYQGLHLSLVQTFGFFIVVSPLLFFIAIVYSGTYYHLWYFPALLLSLYIIDKYVKRYAIKSLVLISLGLIILGASESYFGILPSGVQDAISYYFKFLITTRNFLFFGLFYVSFGYYIGKKKYHDTRYAVLKLLLCIILLWIEFSFLQTIIRLDSNIMLSCIPLTYYLFIVVVQAPAIFRNKNASYYLRSLSKYYYILHPLAMIFFSFLESLFEFSINGFISSVIVVSLTHVFSQLILSLKKKFPGWII